MAKTFEERASAAVANRDFRNAHLSDLIAEGEHLIVQLRSAMESASGDSIDFQLSVEDRDNAALQAEQHRRRIATINGAVDALKVTASQRAAQANAEKVAEEREAALAERDELAARFRIVVPEAIAALTDLFGRVQDNAKRMARSGIKSPDAEAMARGLSSFYNGGPIERFTQIRLPSWSGKGRAWPTPRPDTEAPYIAARKALDAQHEAEIENHWGRYRVRPDGDDGGTSFKVRNREGPRAERVETIYGEPWEGEMAHTEAQYLRKRGVTVEAIAS